MMYTVAVIAALVTAINIQEPGEHRAQCDYASPPTCDSAEVYRSFDGTCNNLVTNTLWGSTQTPFSRYLTADYTDGDWAPRTTSVDTVTPLPNPRLISTTLHEASDSGDLSPKATHMTMIFGQFLTHDITENKLLKDVNGGGLKCCNSEVALEYPDECELAITIPNDDPVYGGVARDCLIFVRAQTTEDLDCDATPKQQMNHLTSFIDLSGVYGSSTGRSNSLRADADGLMDTDDTTWGDITMPQDPDNSAGCVLQTGESCFKVGDSRGNQQPGLTSMHTIFVRYHNIVAGKLKTENPTWNNNILYKESRKITGGMMQYIVYDQYLSVILGISKMTEYDLDLLSSGHFIGYDDTEDPSLRNGFVAAAFRFGHSTIDDALHYVKDDGSTVDKDFIDLWKRPSDIYDEAIGVDSVMRGLAQSYQQKTDRLFSTSITTHMFEFNEGRGADLVSLNIQRGRDHGVPTYNEWRTLCGLSKATAFNTNTGGFVDHRNSPVTKMENLYEDPDDVDLYSGGVSEKTVSGGRVGPTFACIIGKQFRSLKYGDRFWHEIDSDQGFSTPQLDQIRKITLSQIICETTGVGTIQSNVFREIDTSSNPAVDCSTFPAIDFSPWKE